MVAVSAPAKVLVTGASGFVAVWVVKEHIDRGYSVVGTVRSHKKGQYLKGLFGDKFEYVIVEDMGLPDAFDKAVVGVDAIQHTSSPFEMVGGDPGLIIKPAVAGTVNILESVRKYGPDVKRVVITSSIVAAGSFTEPHVLTEDDWNDAAIQHVREAGTDAHPVAKYSASKTLAERAAREFIKNHEEELNYDITTINPPFIWGPMLHETHGPQSFNLSNAYFLGGLDEKNPKSDEELIKKDGEWVDVRDVAKAHVEVLQREDARDGRYIVDAGGYTWQDVYDALNQAPAAKDVPVGRPGVTKVYPYSGSTRLTDLIGTTREEFYRPLAETVKDTLQSARERGWGSA